MKPEITFARSMKPQGGTAVVLWDADGNLSTGAAVADPEDVLGKAGRIADFSGKQSSKLEVLAPAGSGADRLLVLGTGAADSRNEQFWLRLGGQICSAARNARKVVVFLDMADSKASAEEAAGVALGIQLRAYSFDTYKTRKDEDDKKPASVRFTIVTSAATTAKRLMSEVEAVAGGVELARDLVNEPANILGPVEFAAKAKALTRLGVKVEILTEREMRKLGMGALLGVAQGSVRPPRLAVMQWNGGRKSDKPVALVGKGVVFDTGGISMKPAAGMEDMKGDMGGAAAVIGTMHAVAARKAKANVVGIIGLVENMPDGNAQRPGDIVTSMSGQTIEVLNTDAEGRLVLCDALWYCKKRFKPQIMIDLATLTGAIMIALGKNHAGLFSNDDDLADKIAAAGVATAETVWRMPLGPEYDKLIDSKNADMKNIGGRFGGAITAAQFLKRFVDDTPWAHIDVAGTAMGSVTNEINRSWGSGYGVRLLDRLVKDNYER
ncbi:MAG: leucyl aminopeptidase [Rhizobiaceae bacterium]